MPAVERSLLDFLSQRQAQARDARTCHLALVASEDSMLFWIATACKQARLRADRIQSQIAASAVVDQSTINRFENHVAWPKKGGADRLVDAYADDLDVESFRLWREAVQLWERYRAGESLEDLGIVEKSKRASNGKVEPITSQDAVPSAEDVDSELRPEGDDSTDQDEGEEQSGEEA